MVPIVRNKERISQYHATSFSDLQIKPFDTHPRDSRIFLISDQKTNEGSRKLKLIEKLNLL